MLSMPTPPETATSKPKPRSMESITHERIQNIKLRDMGIDPYEFDDEDDEQYTKEEQKLINEALALITLDKDVPEELEQQVKEITRKHK